MKIDFLAVCHNSLQRDALVKVLTQSLDIAYGEHIESYGDDSISFAAEDVAEMIAVNLLRQVFISDGEALLKNIYGFSLDLGIETEGLTAKETGDALKYTEDIIKRFAELLRDEEKVLHIVKFYDDVLLEQNLEMMREVFRIEMKLRQVISLVYLAAARRNDFYNLLEKDKINLPNSAPKDENEYAKICENEFYHLTFGKYAELNNRKSVTQQKELIEIVTQVRDFDELKARLLDNPINDERDADLLASLRDLMTRIEEFRNCVAHNRKVTEELSAFYTAARPTFEENLDDYLKNFPIL